MKKTALLAVLALLRIGNSLAQDIPPGAPEAPESIFQSKLGDADVDLFLQGSWKATASASFGLTFFPDRPLRFGTQFPTYPGGFVFDQKPDLTMSLWLMQRWFAEATFVDKYELNSYVTGYQGKPGEFVQSVKVGTKGVGISPYPYMDFPGAGNKQSPGASAVFETSTSRHELLLRYDPSLPQKKTFVGRNEVGEQRMDPASFIRGRFFVLPDALPDGVEVYLEDPDGTLAGSDGRRYRRAAGYDAAYSLVEGTVSLTKAVPGRVLAYYTKGGTPVGSSASLGRGALVDYKQGLPSTGPVLIDPPGTPRDFDWVLAPAYMGRPLTDYRVSCDGRDCLLLYDPGAFSPFELEAYYSSSMAGQPGRVTLDLVRRGSAVLAPAAAELTAALDPATGVVRLAPLSGSIRSMAFRYPFGGDTPLLYGPDRNSGAGWTDFELLARAYTPILVFKLSDDVIPGSVAVNRNGRPEEGFSVDYKTGGLLLAFEPAPSDTIDVYFRTYSGQGRGGDILFATGHSLAFSEDLKTRFATGLRWNVLKGSYSTQPNDHPGTVAASGELSWKQPNLKLKTDGFLAYTNPDTSGYLRLLGMDVSEIQAPLGKNSIFPSAVPSAAPPGGFPIPGGISQSTRGRLYFKNYESTDLFGATTLNDYSWAPGGQAFPYASGSKPGPYLAMAVSDGLVNPVMVVDYELASGENWVGAQIDLPQTKDGQLDYSAATTLRLVYKAAGQAGDPVRLYLQTGATSEDLDADGLLEEEYSPLDRGYPFHHGGATLLVGGGQDGAGNGLVDSEDVNGNLILDKEINDLVFSADGAYAPIIAAAGAWTSLDIPLGFIDRQKLKNLRSVRLIVAKTTPGANASGRILISEAAFQGSSFATKVNEGGELRVRELAEGYLPGAPLADRYRDIVNLFNAGNTQKAAEIAWSALSGPGWLPSPGWTASRYLAAVPPGRYRKLNLFLRVSSLSAPAVFRLDYTDSQGRGYHQTVPIASADGVWKKLSLDLVERKASLDGNPLSPPVVDAGPDDLTRIELRLLDEGGASTAVSGALHIDELHLSEPIDSLGGGGSAVAEWSLPGRLVEYEGVGLIENLKLAQDLRFRTAAYPGAAGAETVAWNSLFVSSQSSGALDLGAAAVLSGSFGVSRASERVEYSGSHAFRLPRDAALLSLSGGFGRTYRTISPSLSSSLGTRLAIEELPVLTVDWKSEIQAGRLFQAWNLGLDRTVEAWSAKGQTNLEQRRSGFAPEDLPYHAAWADSFKYMAPADTGSQPELRGRLAADYGLKPDPVGFLALTELSFADTAGLDGRRVDRLKTEIGLPLFFKELDDLAFDLRYRRIYTGTLAAAPGAVFADDFALYGQDIAARRFYWSGPPFAEILAGRDAFGFDAQTGGLLLAEYSPEFGLSVSRRIGSRVLDLVVPAKAEGTLRKYLKRDGDSLTGENHYGLKLTHLAVNLFGGAGSLPLFAFYQSDELQYSNGLELRYREDDGSLDWTWTGQEALRLFGYAEDEFGLETNGQVTGGRTPSWKFSGKAQYVWKTAARDDFGLERIRRALEAGGHFRHTEEAGFDLADNGNSLSLNLSHLSTLVLPKLGSVSAELRLGYIGLSREKISMLGLLAALSAHFSF